MAEKDIKLVIRARNDASKAINSVSDALKEFKASQSDLNASSAKTGSALSSLGADFQKLKNEAAALGAIGKVADAIDKSSKAIDRLETEAKQSTAALAAYNAELNKTKAAQSELKSKIADSQRSLAAEASALKSARSERALANAELKKSETRYERINKTIAQGNLSGPKLQIAETKRTTEAQSVSSNRSTANRANATFEQQAQNTAKATENLVGLNLALRANEGLQDKLASSIANTSSKLERSNAAIEGSKKELSEIKSIGNQAAQAFGNISLSQDKLAAASAAVNDDLARTQARLEALSRYSAGGNTFTDPKTAEAIRKQREEISKTEGAWKTLQAEVARTAVAMRGLSQPTQAQVQELQQIKAAAGAAKNEYISLQAALARTQGSTRSSYAEFAKLTGQTKTFAAEAKRSSASFDQAKKSFSMRGIFEPFYGESRQALSLTQRLRGEILSLTAAYVGFFAIMQQAGASITAFRTLEAAQNRLGASFNQDSSQVQRELDFLDRTAVRLGISFGTLADQYSKFVAAGSNANFDGDALREIFTSVAESGRVNKLDDTQIKGIFLALEQMISKGKINAQELRQQLGERLPGAFSIMAKALGVTTAELDKMMEQGEIVANQSTLLKFARQLQEEFGGQLPKSLTSLTTRIGAFQNDIFKAQLLFAQGGFAEALNEALAELSVWFQSREGRDFFLSLGSAAGKLIDVLAVMPQYFDFISVAIRIFVALKLAQVLLGIGARASAAGITLTALRGAVAALGPSMVAATTGALTMGRSMGTAAGAAGVLRAGVIGVGTALRSIPGAVLFTALGVGLSYVLTDWLGGVEDTTSAVDEHRRIMLEVVSAYEAAGKSSRDITKNVKNVTVGQAEANFVKTKDLADEAKKALSSKISKVSFPVEILPTFGLLKNSDTKKLEDFLIAFSKSGAPVTELKKQLAEFSTEIQDLDVKKVIFDLQDLADKQISQTDIMNEAAVVASEMGSNLDIVAESASKSGLKIADLTKAAEAADGGLSQASDSANGYATALGNIQSQIPELAASLKELKELADLDAEFKKIQDFGPVIPAVQAQYNQARQGIIDRNADYSGNASDIALSARAAAPPEIGKLIDYYARQYGQNENILARIIQIESQFNPNAKNPNSSAGGLAQFIDSTAKQYGLKDRYDPAQALDAAARLMRDNAEYLKKVLGREATGGELYLAHQQGMGGAGKLLSNPNASARSIVGDEAVRLNGGSLDMTAQQFAQLWVKKVDGAVKSGATSSGISDAQKESIENEQKAYEKTVSDKKKAAEDAKKDAEKEAADAQIATDKSIADQNFEISQQELINQGKERQAAIEEAIRAARLADKDITAQEIAQIAEREGKLFDLKEQKNPEELATAAEEEVNRLLEIRVQLKEQLAYYDANPNAEKTASTKEELVGVNEQLSLAIEKAIQMQDALGGSKADLAIAKLNSTKLSINDLGNKSQVTGQQIGDMLGNGLTGMFNDFAAAIGRGENAVDAMKNAFLKFASDFLIQIGQMIVKQAIMNGLQGGAAGAAPGGGGGILGSIGGFFAKLFHDGGEVGGAAPLRAVNPSWFNNAIKLHSGGMPKMASNEVPVILEDDEEVLTRTDPRHAKNGGGAGKAANIKVVNTFDAGSFISQGLNSAEGESSFMNYVRANASSIKGALG